MEETPAPRQHWPARRILAAVVSLLLLLASLAAAWQLESLLDLRAGPHEYDIAAWELRNFPSKWLYAFGELFRASPSAAAQDERLARFFRLTRDIENLERRLDESGRDTAVRETLLKDLETLRRERDRLENAVEATIESRLSSVFAEQGIERSLPLVGDFVWPPVDFEFTEPPRALATSRRDRIELIDSRLLKPELDLREVEAIEEETQARDGVSALAFTTAGVGAYPTIVAYTDSYAGAVEVAAHEWLHNYLFFSPLGFRYYASNDLRTLNETVADLVAREVARLVLERWPARESARPPQSPPQGPIDARAELRRLRGEVDQMLAAGQIEAAEALMEERRRELAAQGFYLRKINQAFFAFSNLYAGEAGSPAATNPIGPKVDEARRLSPNLGAFVRSVQGVTSVAELERLVQRLRQASPAMP